MVSESSVSLDVQRAAHHVLTFLEQQARSLGLAPVEVNVLANLPTMGATPTDVARATGHKPSTLTGVLDRLENAGLIERQSHPTDRRALLVVPTSRGRAAARRIDKSIATLDERVCAAVPPAAVEGFAIVVRALAAVAGAIGKGES